MPILGYQLSELVLQGKPGVGSVRQLVKAVWEADEVTEQSCQVEASSAVVLQVSPLGASFVLSVLLQSWS